MGKSLYLSDLILSVSCLRQTVLTKQQLPLGVQMYQAAVEAEKLSWLLFQASRQVCQCEPDNPHPRLALVSIHNNPAGLHAISHKCLGI